MISIGDVPIHVYSDSVHSRQNPLPLLCRTITRRISHHPFNLEADLNPTENQQTTIMGDKSPKSKQKEKDQKQGKQAASNKEKQRIIASKQERAIAPPKKKK